MREIKVPSLHGACISEKNEIESFETLNVSTANELIQIFSRSVSPEWWRQRVILDIKRCAYFGIPTKMNLYFILNNFETESFQKCME